MNLMKIYLLLFILALSNIALGQKSVIRFKHYSTDEGLSQNMVDCILKDSRGFMWFGTWNGLNRFDGYSFTIFKQNIQDVNSLSNNFIYALCEDKFGNIWIGTNNGLNVYIYAENRFVRYFYDKEHLTISSPTINALLCDDAGNIWAGTANGLNKIKVEDKTGRIQSIQYFTAKNTSNGLSSKVVQALSEDRQGNMWIGTDNGLNLLKKDGTILKFRNELKNTNSLSDNNIKSIYVDKISNVWVGTSVGLNQLTGAGKFIQRFYHNPSDPNSIAHNTTMNIVEDLNGRLIFGTLGGISIFKASNHTFTNYTYRINDIYGLGNEFVNCLLADKEGNIWIGTEKGGVNIFNIYQKPFEFLENEPGNPNSLSYNTVNSILEDIDYLWIGTAGGGLNKFDKRKGIFSCFRNNPRNPASISSDFITSLNKDSHKNLWVGTWGGGLNLLQGSTMKNFRFIIHPEKNQNNGVNSYDFVSCILENEEGKLWVGTLGGLVLFDPKNNVYEDFTPNNPTIKITQVGCLQYDSNGNLWAGTIKGLYRILKNNSGKITVKYCKVEYYHNIPSDTKTISGDYVISILKDKRGNMWFGTYGNGLNLFVESKDKGTSGYFTHYTERDGLCNNVVYSIMEDKNNNLWLSTDNGLSKFDIKERRFHNYYKADGLQCNQFYWSSSYKNPSGKMYFGGMKGLNAFYPDSIHDIKLPARTMITDFKIYNQSVEVGKKYNGRVVLSNSISETKKIKLSYKSNEFSFEFSALQYFQPENVNYVYMLEGFDKQWTKVSSSRRFANYTNITRGTYVFKVKAVNDEGQAIQEPFEIQITIIPPFWSTWWFILIITVLIISGFITYYRYRVYALTRQTRKLEKLVSQRTEKIEQQKEELVAQAEQLLETNQQLEKKKEQIEGQKEQLEKQNQEIMQQRDKLIELNRKVQVANQQQLNFFTHISHEFRTPLTLIISPVEQLLTEFSNNGSLKSKLNLINKNAQRMLHLINQLMEIRKIETGKTELKASKDNLVKFVEGISASFNSLAIQKKIKYNLITSEKASDVYFDHEIVENILYNLLSNAFKYTDEKGTVSLIIEPLDEKPTVKEDIAIIDKHFYKQYNISEYLKIEVRDTGIGIAQEQIRDIFRRFYRINSHLSTRTTGTGIGLYLTRELVKAHKGLLYVNSKPGIGTSIKVMLPIGTEHLSPSEIVENAISLNTNNSEFQFKLLKEQLVNSSKEKKNITSENIAEPDVIIEKPSSDKPLILIIDDDNDLRSYLSDSLKTSFHVLKAENGKEGLAMANSHSPDVIISDVMMPEMDGLDLCSRLKNDIQTSHIPVILLTARSEAENYIEGLETGADDYIAKPFNIKIIEAKVKSLIDNRQRLKTLFSNNLIPAPREITTTRSDEMFLQRAIKVVEDNITEIDWSVQEMASELCISRSLLHKKLTAIVGQSAVDFITAIKLKKSALLMHEGNLNISEVAYSVGFNDPKYFSRCFRKYFGKSPSEYVRDNSLI
jgi:ligand-binding sensor domain-containing protein/signal transduction histidine kinase/DNA-binding response OmpR family regulator